MRMRVRGHGAAVVRRLTFVALSVALLVDPAHAAAPTRAEAGPSTAVLHSLPPTGPPTGSPAGTVTVSVSIPDLSAALTDESAPWNLRRAACHQATGLDDEADPVLAACLHSLRP